ncbi:glucosaminidase domain-containing protein [Butyrivibrio sp. WCD2001]|uniref:glucosaminidase domain-containing protein n=1 Tax=Butyrivibrio sp. WCD2001 TaxID=1280681 RepID=UPI00040F685C|nr:glucosaminidase domain-containing protein [Butyrivibrio sp. WCD2001]
MSYTAEEFLSKIKPLVIVDAKSTGILASLTAAQAFIESNKGNSGLTVKANNLFGIKGNYNGQSVTMNTKEYVNGKYITIAAPFRKYPSWKESIADHSAMFHRMKRYSNLIGCRDYKTACQNVYRDGYATGKDYDKTLIKTIEKYGLFAWDGEAGDIIENPYKEPLFNVKAGMKGDSVKWVQTQLRTKGYSLSIDGDFGPKTKAAVIQFQKASGLDPDGIVGTLTRNKLK